MTQQVFKMTVAREFQRIGIGRSIRSELHPLRDGEFLQRNIERHANTCGLELHPHRILQIGMCLRF